MHTYRYRLTLVVNDNGQLHRGSTVAEVRTWTAQSIDQGDMAHQAPKGQAVVVDLGRGRVLFGLISGAGLAVPADPSKPRWMGGAYPILTTKFGLADTSPSRRETRTVEPSPLAREEMPPLVMLRDLNNPLSAQYVDPTDLQSIFGSGVSLQSATIELTSDPLTTGFSNRFKWALGPDFGSRTCSVDDPCLHNYQFVSGIR